MTEDRLNFSHVEPPKPKDSDKTMNTPKRSASASAAPSRPSTPPATLDAAPDASLVAAALKKSSARKKRGGVVGGRWGACGGGQGCGRQGKRRERANKAQQDNSQVPPLKDPGSQVLTSTKVHPLKDPGTHKYQGTS